MAPTWMEVECGAGKPRARAASIAPERGEGQAKLSKIKKRGRLVSSRQANRSLMRRSRLQRARARKGRPQTFELRFNGQALGRAGGPVRARIVAIQ